MGDACLWTANAEFDRTDEVPEADPSVDDIPEQLLDQIDTQTGDYREDDLESGYDVALLFNVVHAHEPDENIALLERVGAALAPRGRVVVLDQWDGSGRTPMSRAGLRFVALTYLTTLGATVYAHEDVVAWLREAGFSDVQRRSIGPLSGLAIVEASKWHRSVRRSSRSVLWRSERAKPSWAWHVGDSQSWTVFPAVRWSDSDSLPPQYPPVVSNRVHSQSRGLSLSHRGRRKAPQTSSW